MPKKKLSPEGDLGGTHNVFGAQLAKLCLRLGVADMASVPPALVGLISQIDGSFGHGQPLR